MVNNYRLCVHERPYTLYNDEGGGVIAACGSAGSPAVALAALSRVAGPEDRDQHAHKPVEEK